MTNKQTRSGESQLNFLDEIIVDNFAGGGGASTGMELATGRPVAIAINHDPDAKPMHTVTSHDREAIVCAHICKYYGGVIGAEAQEPLPTVTAVDHNAVAAAHIVEFKGRDIGQDADRPLRTITASAGEFADCRAELMEAGSQDLMHWPEVRDLLNRHCGYEMADDEILLLEIGGGLYFIADILLRMLTPRELYNAMGFPPDYIIDRDYLGNEYGKTKQVARCGNAVCPPMATALVRANLPEWYSRTITTMEELEKAVTA